MKPRWVNPVDEPGSITDKQKLTMNKLGLIYTDTTTSREAAKAIAYFVRQNKKEPQPSKRRGKKRRRRANSRRYEGTGSPVTTLSEKEYQLKLEEEARSISERAKVERKTNH